MATGTLAQGIQMPAKSTVMFGDSIFLHAESYLQWSGRSGRRGFDKRGHTVFFGVPLQKVNRLLTCETVPVVSNKTVTVSTVLRFLIWHHRSNEMDKKTTKHAEKRMKDAVDACSRMLWDPFSQYLSFGVTTVGKNEAEVIRMKELASVHFRFALTFLHREGLINDHGVPNQSVEMSGRYFHFY